MVFHLGGQSVLGHFGVKNVLFDHREKLYSRQNVLLRSRGEMGDILDAGTWIPYKFTSTSFFRQRRGVRCKVGLMIASIESAKAL